MKKRLLTLTVALALSLGTVFAVAHADEMEDMMMNSYCPMMSLKHSKELGLSKKQEAKLQKIKDDMWAQMKPIAMKSSGDTEAVLNDKQKAKYKEIMSSMMGHCGCGKDKDGGDSCEMKKDNKE
ncbi:MAG TPA: hypothetical protein VFX30_02935 [bacterium]|nr:hypothetical protein [bacterium]